MKWFRFYSEVLHDSKVQTLTPELFRAWVNVLCIANVGQPRGRLPELKQIAFALRVKEDKAAQIIGQLTACGLIDTDGDGRNLPHNWDERQPESDDVNARVREHRKRKAHVPKADDVTLHATNGKRDMYGPEENRREEKRTPPTPPTGGDDEEEGGFSQPPEDPSTLRSQRKAIAPQAQLDALTAWARTVIGERGEVEFYFSKLPGWAASYPIGWIETAVLCTAAKTDIRAGGLAQYTNGCLTKWHPDGPPKDMKRVADRQRSTADAQPLAYHQPSPERIAEIEAEYDKPHPKSLRKA